MFYGGAIGSVVALFSLTTAYGEANLRAQRSIDGRYPIATSSLPGCLQSKKLVLFVQQSGIYLTGSLLLADAAEETIRVAEERPSLTGQWQNQQFTLDGTIGYLPGCQDGVRMRGAIAQESLNGTLRLNSAPDEIHFSAQREAPKAKSQEH